MQHIDNNSIDSGYKDWRVDFLILESIVDSTLKVSASKHFPHQGSMVVITTQTAAGERLGGMRVVDRNAPQDVDLSFHVVLQQDQTRAILQRARGGIFFGMAVIEPCFNRV